MLQLRRRFLGLCLVPVLLAALDGWVTLHGQPEDYWAGNHSHVIEGSPAFHRLLTYGPMAYIAGLSGWVLAFVGMILLTPQTLALAVCIAFTLGHAIGASSWLVDLPYGYQLYAGMCVFAAAGLALGIRWGWRAEPQNDAPVGVRLHFSLRWLIIAVLCGIEVYYLWPHKL
ncbi:MAG TPA: hypothetical protein VNZ64_05830 [Candidatus Acidoferrum sp.]|jgi:hypothetical protein|nr:hypothetical protein [Candidatus Acidoferrum sp.]